MNLEQLKYPIGRFQKPDIISKDILHKSLETISSFPSRLEKSLHKLHKDQFDIPYRPGGWTVRQVVNHCADSHMNGLMRVKLTLTENKPVIKPYLEDRWAELGDSKNSPIEPALAILRGVHERWSTLLESLNEDQWQRNFIHPESGKEISLTEITCLYAWHCEHHLGHVALVGKEQGF